MWEHKFFFSVSVEERVLAVEPILCYGIEEAIPSFGLNFT